MRWVGWVVLALLLVAVIGFFGAMANGGFFYGPMMNYGGYPYSGWFFFPFGFFFVIIFIFFIFRFAFWGWGGWGWRRRYGYGYSDAHEILRQRYARGEITKDQFDQMTRDLEQHEL